MILFRFLVYFSCYIFVSGSNKYQILQRTKRSNITFQGEGPEKGQLFSDINTMIKILTNRDETDFNVYGLYCVQGYVGYGIPVDPIDRCCQEHKFCKENTRKSQCLLSRMLNAKYNWHYNGKQIRCVNSHRCLKAKCVCDRNKATCLRDHIDEYNSIFLGRFLDRIIG